jgi:hypothetical protein
MSPKSLHRPSISGIVAVGVFAGIVCVAWAHGDETKGGATKGQEEKKDKGAKSGPATIVVEAQLRDNSTINLILHDANIELQTVYGNLKIPVAAVARIEFGVRLSADEQRRIAGAIADLGHAEPPRRDAAVAALEAMEEKAYKALVLASQGGKTEMARRATDALTKLRAAQTEEELEAFAMDVVHTSNSKFTGLIKVSSFKVGTLAFGDQQLKLTDIRSIRSQAAESSDDGKGEVLTVGKGGLKVEAKLAVDDKRHDYHVFLEGMDLNLNMRMKTYRVRLDKGKHVLNVDAGDEEFDPLLAVFDETGKMIAYDDDGGGKYDSRLELNSKRGGIYTIHVAGMRDTMGPYTLRINAKKADK